MENKRRDPSIDILRFIALVGIIIAHIQPPEFLFQLRNFDVPMMVFLSGIAFSLSNGKKESYRKYVWKRFKRLMLPTMIFVLIYVLWLYFRGFGITPIDKAVFTYFLAVSGNGFYTWIIRIFFIIALFAPFVAKLVQRTSLKKYFILIVCTLCINEGLCIAYHGPVYDLFIMNISYIAIFSFGAIANKFNRKELKTIMLIAFAIFVVIALILYCLTGNYINTQDYKYPPQIYYIAYALGTIVLLYLYKDKITAFFKKVSLTRCCTFIGSHTIWIYFWHIIILDMVKGQYNWGIRFLITIAAATLITLIQNILIQRLSNKITNSKIRKNLQILFAG